ncbi:MAG TPA: carboxypeptidase-like regulatory domain-containing protein [Thermoanaerobaculia bacterium]|nr:carboxypeptidase-like regulatory domain-containing protein [Thermoanaerobaculia bacterium]
MPLPARRKIAGIALAAAAALSASRLGATADLTVSVRVEAERDGEMVSGASIALSAPAPFAAAGPCHPLAPEPAAAASRPGEDGGAVLPVPRAGVWRLVVRAPGKVPAEAFVGVLSAEEALPPVALDASEDQAILLVDPAGHPLDGATIVAVTGELPMTARFPWTDPALRDESGGGGKSSLPDGPRNWRLGVSLPGYAPWSGDRAPLRVTLKPAASRLLRLLGPRGEPLAAARLWDAESCAELGTADAGGEVGLTAAEGRRRIVVAAPDGRRWSGVPGAPEGAGAASEPWSWKLPEPHPPLAGRLEDGLGGAGLVGALVWSAEDPASWARSDGAGRFTLPWPVLSDAVEIHVRAAGFLPLAARRRLGARATAEVVLAPVRPFAGRVVDETGRPVAGAEITARPHDPRPGARARSGADGSFLLRDLWPQSAYALTAAAAGHGSATLELETGSQVAGQPPEKPARVVLCRQIPVAVTVRDAKGSPLAGADVALSGLAHPVSLKTGMDGSVELPAPPAAILGLSIRAPGFAPLATTWEPPEKMEDEPQCRAGRVPPKIELERSLEVAGRVADPRGLPLAEAEVWDLARKRKLATTGPDGRFALHDLAVSKEGLRVCRTGFRPLELQVRPPVLEALAVTLEPASGIAGRVVRQDGSPAVDVEVFANQTGGSPKTTGPPREYCPTEADWRSARTDAGGRFLVVPLVPGWFVVTANDGAGGFADSAPVRVAASETAGEVDLTLGPATRAVGRIVDEAGAPVLATVAVKRLELSTSTDADGRFTLAPLRPGDEMVEAEADWLSVSRLVALSPGDNEIELVLPVRPLRRISGRLVDTDGAPVAESILKLEGTVYRDRFQQLDTNPDGSFLFDLVEEGEYRLRVMETFAEHQMEPATIEVAGGDVADLVVRFLPAPDITVTGRVVGADPRHPVEVTADGPGEQRSADAEPDGSYRIEHLVPGRWMLRARENRETGAEAPVMLSPESPEVVQDLVFSLREVSGRVADRAGDPVPDVDVVLEPGGHLATTAADGSFTLHAADGSYRVQIERQNHRLDLPGDLQVSGGPLTGVELTLATSTLHGKMLGLEPGEAPTSAYVVGGAGSGAIDADGAFTIEGVAPGRWTVEAGLAGGESATGEVTVPVAAADVPVELTIERGSFELAGRITGAVDPSLFAVEIRRQDGRYGSRSAIDSQGVFRFEHLAPGDYAVVIDALTDESWVIVAHQELTLAGSDSVEIAIDPGVKALRWPPAAPVD